MDEDYVVRLLRDKGLKIRQAEDVYLLLKYKPERVQRAFVMRCEGHKQWYIAQEIGIAQQTVSKYIIEQCSDIYDYLTTNWL